MEANRVRISEPLDDLPGALIFVVGVGPHEVEVELVGVHLGKEVSATREVFEAEELVFFEAMHGFQVALVGVGGGRDAHMPTVTAGFGTSVLNSPPLSVCQTRSQRDAVAIEVPLGTEGEGSH